MAFKTGLLAATLMAATSGGCGGSSAGGGTVSCTTVDTQTSGGMLQLCQEGAGSPQITRIVQANCVAAQGGVDAGFTETADFQNAPCPRDGAVGGCRSDAGAGASITLWFYNLANQHQTAADVMANCATSGATFVAP